MAPAMRRTAGFLRGVGLALLAVSALGAASAVGGPSRPSRRLLQAGGAEELNGGAIAGPLPTTAGVGTGVGATGSGTGTRVAGTGLGSGAGAGAGTGAGTGTGFSTGAGARTGSSGTTAAGVGGAGSAAQGAAGVGSTGATRIGGTSTGTGTVGGAGIGTTTGTSSIGVGSNSVGAGGAGAGTNSASGAGRRMHQRPPPGKLSSPLTFDQLLVPDESANGRARGLLQGGTGDADDGLITTAGVNSERVADTYQPQSTRNPFLTGIGPSGLILNPANVQAFGGRGSGCGQPAGNATQGTGRRALRQGGAGDADSGLITTAGNDVGRVADTYQQGNRNPFLTGIGPSGLILNPANVQGFGRRALKQAGWVAAPLIAANAAQAAVRSAQLQAATGAASAAAATRHASGYRRALQQVQPGGLPLPQVPSNFGYSLYGPSFRVQPVPQSTFPGTGIPRVFPGLQPGGYFGGYGRFGRGLRGMLPGVGRQQQPQQPQL